MFSINFKSHHNNFLKCVIFILAVTLKRCPDFKILDEIFGNRASINPPAVIDSATVVDLIESESIDYNNNEVMVRNKFNLVKLFAN